MEALGAASAILTFVTFSGRLLIEAYNVHTGSSENQAANQDLKLIAASLSSLNDSVQCSAMVGSAHGQELRGRDQEIQELCQACADIADELVPAINKIHSRNQGKLWVSLVEALKTVWSQPDIKRLQGRINALQQQIQLLILASIQ